MRSIKVTDLGGACGLHGPGWRTTQARVEPPKEFTMTALTARTRVSVEQCCQRIIAGDRWLFRQVGKVAS